MTPETAAPPTPWLSVLAPQLKRFFTDYFT